MVGISDALIPRDKLADQCMPAFGPLEINLACFECFRQLASGELWLLSVGRMKRSRRRSVVSVREDDWGVVQCSEGEGLRSVGHEFGAFQQENQSISLVATDLSFL
jgi:hypothetical protein